MKQQTAKNRRLQGAAVSQGARVSKGMGPSDPRSHRNPQVATAPEIQIAPPLRIGADQRLGLRPARGVPSLAADASTADLVAAFNSLLIALRERGIIEG